MSPYNATFSGAFDNLTPPGRNLSYYYSYGECAGFPTNAVQTTTMTYPNAPANSSVQPVTVGSLEPSTNYCYTLCIQDGTCGYGWSGWMDWGYDHVIS